MTSIVTELKDGAVLSGVVEVEWLHQNIFVALFRASPAVGENATAAAHPDAVGTEGMSGSRSKHVDGVRALQFELTQCSVPTGSHSLLSSTIRRVLRHAHRVGEMCLRLDLVSMSASDSASRECFGDVLYGVDRCGSLQRDLLALGVARVIRPGFDTRSLIKAEGLAIQDGRSTFSVVIYEYETSAKRRVEVRGLVLDAMRGHWIRVGEIQDASSVDRVGPVPLPEWVERNGTLLVQVDSLDCDGDLPAAWATGFDATRFTQEFLVGCTVRLVVHEAVPADKELSNNTQEIEYDQLAHVKATVYVEHPARGTLAQEYLPRGTRICSARSQPLQRGRWGWKPSEADAEATAERCGDCPDETLAGTTLLLWKRVDEWLRKFRGDWGRVLLRAGLARLCPPLDFCAPRSENYCALLLDVQDLAALHARDSPPVSLRQLWREFLPHRRQDESGGAPGRGQDGTLRWDGKLRREDVTGKQRLAAPVTSEHAQQPVAALSADVDTDSSTSQHRKHRWTPLKFLCSFEQLLVEPAGPNVSGFITQVARLRFSTAAVPNASTDGVCSCLRLSVAVALCDTVVERVRKEHLAESRGSISVSPPSTESATVNVGDAMELPTFSHLADAECWGPKLRFTASYDPELSGLDAKACEAQLSVASFNADQPLTPKELHQALADGRHGSLALDLLQSSGIELSLPAGSERRLFVVECRIRCEGEGVTSARAFYVLSQNGGKGNGERSLQSGGVREHAEPNAQTGVDAGVVAVEDEEEAFEMAEREVEAPQTEVDDGDALLPNGDAKPKVGTATRQVPQSSTSPTSPPSGGVDATAAHQGSITVHHALIDVLLPLPTTTVAALDSDVDGARVWQDVTGALLFKSVDVSLAHVVFVEGRRCFLITSVSSPTDPTLSSWVAEHLHDRAALSCVFSARASSPLSPSQREVDGTDSGPSSGASAAVQQPRFGRSVSCVVAEQHGAHARPLLPHVFAVGTREPGRHASPSDPPDKTPLLTLTPFAIGLRQLFASHPKQHRNVITETERSTASGWAHVDAAFMRLRFPRLPCYLRSNLEWLPPLVQDALTDVVASGPLTPGGPPRDNSQAPSDPIVPPEVSLLCMERPLAALLSSLLMITPLRGNAPLPRELRDPAVQANFRLDICGFRSTAVLYCADRDEHGGLHERQGLCEARGGEEGRRGSVLVFASRRTIVDSAFDPNVVLPIKLPPKVTQRLLVALAMESATCAEEDALDEADRVLGETSFARRPLSLPYWLYQPTAVEGIGVLGEPLVTVPRECLTELHNSSVKGGSSGTVPLCYQYVAVRSATAANPYRFVSYGQLNRNLLVQHQARQWKRGRHVVDYVTLLLRQCNAAGGIPAGVLKAYGNAFEPLYLHYVSRDSMRRQIAYGWDLFRSDVGAEALEREEACLWERLIQFAKLVLQRVADEVKGVPVLLSMDCRLANSSSSTATADGDDEGNSSVPSPPTPISVAEQTSTGGVQPPASTSWSFLVINVFPIGSLTAAPTAPSSIPSSSSCRDVLMRENVYGRLPSWQVHIRYVGGDAWFSYTIERLKT